ncbi:MAG TPA: hypothetical protein VKR52_07795 [Terracidiphilus sp.]|nr:hypothetical protein [Terracidiphilus sp.]
MPFSPRVAVAFGLLIFAWPVAAQVQLGEAKASANGTISTGYTADYGNMSASSHDWTLGGTAALSGSYYSPNFLSYNASVYLNQSRSNSDFQSISNTSGVNLTTNIFSGSKFPGSVSYSTAYDSEGNYAVPGLANYVTHGNSRTLGINWSELLPDKPSFSAAFQLGNSDYSVYGTNDEGNNSFHSLNLHSGYQIDGFNMGGYFTSGGSHALIPPVIEGEPGTGVNSDTRAYGLNVQHRLPLQGSAAASWTRSHWGSVYSGTNSTGTIDTFNGLAAVHPSQKLALSVNATYSDNLAGQLIESVVSAGGEVAGFNADQSSTSMDVMGTAGYAPGANLQTDAFVERRTQYFLGQNYGVNSYGVGATYAHGLLNGTFNSAFTFTANTSDNTGEDTLGFSTNDNYSAVWYGWHVMGSFGYAQNAQTLLVTYMNSVFNYSGNVRRNWGRFHLGLGASSARTGLTQQAGDENSSQGYNATLGYGPMFTATGTYSKSNGQAIATGSGLVTVTVPPPTLPSGLVTLFGGNSYSFGISSAPVKHLIMSASYSKSNSNMTGNSLTSTNNNTQFNSIAQYQFRKLNYISGYSRLEQGFSTSGSQPQIISSFYMGISRWFNFF